jgi:small-conductance mechanosensitive channel
MTAKKESPNVEIVELVDTNTSSGSTSGTLNGQINNRQNQFDETEEDDTDSTIETSVGSVETDIKTASSYQSTDFIYSGVILLMAFLAIKFINRNLWARYEETRGKPAPQILITLLNGFIIIFAVSFISVAIFDQSLFGLLTAGGVAGVGFAMALQGPILDFFSGIMMDVEGRISNGDWVRLSSGVEGRVIGHNWRSITLMTINNTVIVIANSRFSQDQYENISSEGEFWDSVEITIDYNVSTERAQRILQAALIKAPGVHNKTAQIFAMKMTEGGIVYTCRYKMTDYSQKALIRHNAIQAMMNALHGYKLSVSETLGEYIISQRKEHDPAWRHVEGVDLLEDFLHKTPIIQDLGATHIDKLNNHNNLERFNVGADICVEGDEGDSMYVILEGLVDILITDPETKKKVVVSTLGPADYFGEMALFMGDKRRATVRAKTSLVVLNIHRKLIVPVIKNDPRMVDQIGEIIIKHLEANKAFLESLEEKEPNPKPPLLEIVCKQMLKVFGL